MTLAATQPFGFLARSGKTFLPWLPACCHLMLPSPRRGQKHLSPHPHPRPGAALEQEELPLIQREKEQHEHVTACPGARSTPWPYFNLCFKLYLLFQRKQPVGSVSYDKRVNDGLPNSGQPEPLHISGSERKTQVAKSIIQYCCHKPVGINFSEAPMAPGGGLHRSQAERLRETTGEQGNSCRTSCPPTEVTNNLFPLCCTKQPKEVAFIFFFKAKYILKSTGTLLVISITEGFGGAARSCLRPQSSWLSAGCQGGVGNLPRVPAPHTAALHTPHPQFACTNLGCEGMRVSQGESLHKQGEQVKRLGGRGDESIAEAAGDKQGSVTSEVEETDKYAKIIGNAEAMFITNSRCLKIMNLSKRFTHISK